MIILLCIVTDDMSICPKDDFKQCMKEEVLDKVSAMTDSSSDNEGDRLGAEVLKKIMKEPLKMKRQHHRKLCR